jgi:hypothetical protein
LYSEKTGRDSGVTVAVVAGLLIGIGFVLIFSFLTSESNPILGKLSSSASPGNAQQAMLERGNIAMGFDQNKIMHHFMATSTGGKIMIVALNSNDSETVSQIRQHVMDIKQEFSQGNFTKPFFIHDQQVPGTDMMVAKKDLIRFSTQQLDNGAVLTLATDDKELLSAVQQFMNFQGREHMRH